jgi:hypothetical protein
MYRAIFFPHTGHGMIHFYKAIYPGENYEHNKKSAGGIYLAEAV